MTNFLTIIFILIIIALGVWAVRLYKDKNNRGEYAELGKGLAEYNQKLQQKKEQAKEKIVSLFEKQAKVSNHDVAKALSISSASATRYLDELENEGKLKQIGKVGKYVYYSKI